MKQKITDLLPALRRFAWSLTNSAHDADDLLQATVERLLKKGVPEGVELDRWAFRVCRNLWIDEYRARKVRWSVAWDASLSELLQVNGEKKVHAEMELEQVKVAMQQLPEDQHLVLSMVAVQGMSYKAVAEELNIPLGTVMSRLARARSRLVGMLQPANSNLQEEVSL